MKIVYLVRHSEPMAIPYGYYNAIDSMKIIDEKNPLSVEGEQKAKALVNNVEFSDVKELYSSHYVRAISTAKYIAKVNNINLNVDEVFGEIEYGVNNMRELTNDFFIKQINDQDFKTKDGESFRETSYRMFEGLSKIIKKSNKKAMIVSHRGAITALLNNWCELKTNTKTNKIDIYFNNKIIFDGNWDFLEIFKLVFEDMSLISIENIKNII